VAERFGATPFDVDGRVLEPPRGALHLRHHDRGVRPRIPGARPPRPNRPRRRYRPPDLAPEAAGLLAASLGLSHTFGRDLDQLAAGMTLYDAFYRWSRDAAHETHTWPAPVAKGVPA
jgi:hypothetical protein